MNGPVTLFVESYQPHVALVVGRLGVQLGSRVSVRLGEPSGAERAPWVAVGTGSAIRPCLTVRFSRPYSDGAVDAALPLALSEIAWRGTDVFEPWRVLNAPVSARPIAGAPDPTKRWLLFGADVRSPYVSDVSSELQIHRVAAPMSSALRSARGATELSGTDVLWPATAAALAPVLGRVERVRGVPPELGWDARRAGISGDVVEAWEDRQRLAGVVPPASSVAVARWIADVLDGATPAAPPLLALDWRPMYEAPDRWRPARLEKYSAAAARMRRKWRKLRRDPEGFVRDSDLACRLATLWQ